MKGKYLILIAIVIVVVLLTILFVNQNQSKKAVVTVSHTQPTAVVTTIPTSAGQSATITPLQVTVTVKHVIITATPGESNTPTNETSPTPNP
jgi:uncharacterized protein YpmS